MRKSIGLALAALLTTTLSVGCTKSEPPGPTREEIRAKLDQEAQAVKRDGEAGPDLGVKSVWTVEGVDMSEKPGDARYPWTGSVRIAIVTRSQDATAVQEDRAQKTFAYKWDTVLQRWVMEYQPK